MVERRQDHATLHDNVMSFTAAFVAIAIVVLTAITTWYLLTHEIPKDNQTIVGQLQGSLWTSLGVIVAYFYVGSVGSRAKDRTLESMAKTASTQATAAAVVAPATGTLVIPEGESAVASATPSGTVITVDEDPTKPLVPEENN